VVFILIIAAGCFLCGLVHSVRVRVTVACGVIMSDDRDGNVANHDNSGAGSADEQDDEDEAMQYYDRSKSFFDNISCESTERAKG